MIVAVTLAILIPLAFWLLDVFVKVLGAFSTDDVGADLCLFGVSFNGSTLLTAAMSSRYAGAAAASDSAAFLSALTGASLILSMILYVFSMILISPSRPRTFPVAIAWLRARSWRVSLTVFLGFITLAIEIGLYVLLWQAGGRP